VRFWNSWVLGVRRHRARTNPSNSRIQFFGVRVSGFRLRISGFGSGVSGVGFRVLGFELRASGLGFGVWGLGFRVSGFQFRVSGFGFRVSGFRFRVSSFNGAGRASHSGRKLGVKPCSKPKTRNSKLEFQYPNHETRTTDSICFRD
jgi:hypothetical protein